MSHLFIVKESNLPSPFKFIIALSCGGKDGHHKGKSRDYRKAELMKVFDNLEQVEQFSVGNCAEATCAIV